MLAEKNRMAGGRRGSRGIGVLVAAVFPDFALAAGLGEADRQPRLQEAAPLLERALALDPEHAKARRALAATRQALVRPIP